MHFKVNLLSDLNIIELVTNGSIDHNARKEIIRIAWAALDKSDCEKLLINKSEATRLFDHQMTGALELVNMMDELGMPRKLAIAIVSPETASYDEFFKEIARLKDFCVKNFTRREAALQWLYRDDEQRGAEPF